MEKDSQREDVHLYYNRKTKRTLSVTGLVAALGLSIGIPALNHGVSMYDENPFKIFDSSSLQPIAPQVVRSYYGASSNLDIAARETDRLRNLKSDLIMEISKGSDSLKYISAIKSIDGSIDSLQKNIQNYETTMGQISEDPIYVLYERWERKTLLHLASGGALTALGLISIISGMGLTFDNERRRNEALEDLRHMSGPYSD